MNIADLMTPDAKRHAVAEAIAKERRSWRCVVADRVRFTGREWMYHYTVVRDPSRAQSIYDVSPFAPVSETTSYETYRIGPYTEAAMNEMFAEIVKRACAQAAIDAVTNFDAKGAEE